MNKHIELVKKWLDDPSSVSQEELEANSNAAETATYAAYAAADAIWSTPAYAAHWVNKYEELTNGNK